MIVERMLLTPEQIAGDKIKELLQNGIVYVPREKGEPETVRVTFSHIETLPDGSVMFYGVETIEE